jgi:uncharacterized protein YbaR (Trm112 family)
MLPPYMELRLTGILTCPLCRGSARLLDDTVIIGLETFRAIASESVKVVMIRDAYEIQGTGPTGGEHARF